MGNVRRGQQMKIFVSHTSSDKAICDRLVASLRSAGADVWYDEHNLGAGTLRPEIMRELAKRPVFIVVLSKAALTSKWVQDECEWAFNLYRRKSARLILPVTASVYDPNDFDHLLYLEGLTRIEGPDNQPYPPQEMIAQTLRILSLTPAGERPVASIPQPNESLADLLAQGRALNAQSKHAEALPFFERATSQSPRSAYAWYGVGDTLNSLGRYDGGRRL